mmetsp:Transcript_10858/g.23279  ORF Transcript_10858/g.23279 Transcript_10858/m.23279 type:complete len:448 (-) Transcript_10858:335-1678(-)
MLCRIKLEPRLDRCFHGHGYQGHGYKSHRHDQGEHLARDVAGLHGRQLLHPLRLGGQARQRRPVRGGLLGDVGAAGPGVLHDGAGPGHHVPRHPRRQARALQDRKHPGHLQAVRGLRLAHHPLHVHLRRPRPLVRGGAVQHGRARGLPPGPGPPQHRGPRTGADHHDDGLRQPPAPRLHLARPHGGAGLRLLRLHRRVIVHGESRVLHGVDVGAAGGRVDAHRRGHAGQEALRPRHPPPRPHHQPGGVAGADGQLRGDAGEAVPRGVHRGGGGQDGAAHLHPRVDAQRDGVRGPPRPPRADGLRRPLRPLQSHTAEPEHVRGRLHGCAAVLRDHRHQGLRLRGQHSDGAARAQEPGAGAVGGDPRAEALGRPQPRAAGRDIRPQPEPVPAAGGACTGHEPQEPCRHLPHRGWHHARGSPDACRESPDSDPAILPPRVWRCRGGLCPC